MYISGCLVFSFSFCFLDFHSLNANLEITTQLTAIYEYMYWSSNKCLLKVTVLAICQPLICQHILLNKYHILSSLLSLFFDLSFEMQRCFFWYSWHNACRDCYIFIYAYTSCRCVQGAGDSELKFLLL